MPSLEEFLSHVLSTESHLCGVCINPKNKRSIKHAWFKPGRIAELAKWLDTADRAGLDAYFGCGGFTEIQSRKAINSAGSKSFWLDIDAGNGKPYPDADAAADAADQFALRLGLPMGTAVYSGNGVHYWWALDGDLSAPEWHRVATRLKELCREHGLQADPDRTADIASILRPPGTHNYKDLKNPRKVDCYDLEPIISKEAFVAVVMAGNPGSLFRKPPGLGWSLGAKISQIYDPNRKAFAEPIARNCNQIRAFRGSGGRVPEPLWYAALGVLSRCSDGLAHAQTWSSGDPRYDEAGTARKYTQAENAPGPTTCERFKGINPGGCTGCPHSVTSPIQLGYPGVVEREPVAVKPEEKPWLPFGFHWGQNMQLVHRAAPDAEGLAKETLISEFPIYLSAVRRGEKSPVTMYEFRKKEPHRDWHTFEIAASEMYKTTWPAVMAQHGANIRTDAKRHFIWFLEAYVEQLKSKSDEGIQFEQYGWKKDMTAFLVGDTLFKEDGTEESCPGMLEAGNRAYLLEPHPRGSLEKWSSIANRMFAPGFEAQGFSLLMPFAAPIMKFITNGQEGGTIYSMSSGGGKGKSTIIAAIASVYGQLQALQIKNSDTEVAKERIQITACNLPVVWDEWMPGSAKLFEPYVRAFTTGKAKSRGTRTGVISAAPDGWETILIAGSNGSMVENLSGTSSSEPMANRIFEVDVELPPGVGVKDSDWGRGMNAEFMDNRGYAGRAFIKYIVRPEVRRWIETNIDRILGNYASVLKAETADRYTVRTLACAAVAASIVNKLGILTFDIPAIMTWATNKAKQSTEVRREFFQTEADVLMRFIREHSEGCLTLSGPYSYTKPPIVYKEPRRQLVMRLEETTNRLYISSDAIRRWCHDISCTYSNVIRGLEKDNIVLNRARMTQLAAGSKLPPIRTHCWEVDLTHRAIGGARVELKAVENNPSPLQGVKV